MQAMEHGVGTPFLFKATLDLAGQWWIMGFSRSLIS